MTETDDDDCVGADSEIRPIDPLNSRYPLPMSAHRARFEARRARALKLRLPIGHPYRTLPVWLPYGLASFLSRL